MALPNVDTKWKRRAKKQTVKVKVASRLSDWSSLWSVCCVDHSAAMCLFFMFTVQPLSRDRASLLPQAFLSPFSPSLCNPFSSSTSLPAAPYSVLMSLVATIGLHG